MRPVVFVVGDLILDHYVEGSATHIAPDAPVPVVVIEGAYTHAGGMWNAAANVRAAGATMRCFGVDGPNDDPLRAEVERVVFPDGEAITLEVPGRRTHIKTRILGDYGRQMLRMDVPKDKPISIETQFLLIDRMKAEAAKVGDPEVIFIADYGCGVVTDQLVSLLGGTFPSAKLVADPYPTTDPKWYQGVHVLTPNGKETGDLCAMIGATEVAGLCELAECVIVKQGSAPVVVIMREGEPFDVKPPKVDLVCPCGAGDSFTAYLCVELALGRPMSQAVLVAAHAGACAVLRQGVQVVERAEVEAAMNLKPVG